MERWQRARFSEFPWRGGGTLSWSSPLLASHRRPQERGWARVRVRSVRGGDAPCGDHEQQGTNCGPWEESLHGGGALHPLCPPPSSRLEPRRLWTRTSIVTLTPSHGSRRYRMAHVHGRSLVRRPRMTAEPAPGPGTGTPLRSSARPPPSDPQPPATRPARLSPPSSRCIPRHDWVSFLSLPPASETAH